MKSSKREFLSCLLDLNLSGPTENRTDVSQYLGVAAGMDLGVSVRGEMVEDIRHVSKHIHLVHMNLCRRADRSTSFEMQS